MATTYVADPTAADTPSVAPDEDDVPSSLIPVDGDPPNAATFVQGLKVAPDWVAWLKKPFAKASAWTKAVVRWQNALKQDRFLVDHAGFPGGRVRQITERWRGIEQQLGAGTVIFNDTDLNWTVNVVDAGGGQVIVTGPDSATITERHVSLTLGTGATDKCLMIGDGLVMPGVAKTVVCEWDVFLGAAINQQHLSTGLAHTLSDQSGDDSTFMGAVFMIDDSFGAGAWLTVVGDGTTLGTPFNPGIATNVNTLFKMRLEWWGSGTADDSVASIRLYINGAPAGVFTTNIPAPDLHTMCPVIGTKRASGSANRTFCVSPMRITYNP